MSFLNFSLCWNSVIPAEAFPVQCRMEGALGVLCNHLSCLHILVWHLQWQRIFCCFLLQFVKVKATTWNQTATEAPEMLSINRNSFFVYASVSVKSHCVWIAICCKKLNSDLDELQSCFLMLTLTGTAKPVCFFNVKIICTQMSS